MAINVKRLDIKNFIVPIIGETSLIMHRWSEKARKEMLDKQMKKTIKSGREAKNPKKEFESSIYRMSGDRYGFPAAAFKAVACRAAKTVEGLAITDVKAAMHVDAVEDGLIEIVGEPTMREDMVRVAGGTADIRYRAEFMPWQADIPVTYNAGVLTEEIITNLLSIGGFGTGIGDWRPEKSGNHGIFKIRD